MRALSLPLISILLSTFLSSTAIAQSFNCELLLTGKDMREVRDGFPFGSIRAKRFAVNLAETGGTYFRLTSADLPASVPPITQPIELFVSPNYNFNPDGSSAGIAGLQLVLSHRSETGHSFFASAGAPLVNGRLISPRGSSEFSLVSEANNAQVPGVNGAILKCVQAKQRGDKSAR